MMIGVFFILVSKFYFNELVRCQYLSPVKCNSMRHIYSAISNQLVFFFRYKLKFDIDIDFEEIQATNPI